MATGASLTGGGFPSIASGREGRQLEYATILRRLGDVAFAQCKPDRFKFSRILKRKVWRPSTFLFDEFDRDGRLQKLLPLAQPERMTQLREIRSRAGSESPRVLLERLKIFPVHRDARDSNLLAGSIDFIFSNINYVLSCSIFRNFWIRFSI